MTTQQMIMDDLNDQQVKSLCIGQAGENLVRFANVRTGAKNAAGRTGIGAVMGSKKLKAVAARGTLGVEIAHPEEALKLYEEKLRQLARFPASGPAIQNAPRRYPLRAFLIGKFPYSIIAGPIDGVMTIVAVAHTSREPGYWRDRVD